MPAYPHLRLVRNDDNGGEGENERGQQQTEPQRSDGVQVDPRLAAFLDKHAVSNRHGRVVIFLPDEVVVLKSETLGMSFSQQEIDMVERWLVKFDPYRDQEIDMKERMARLDQFVNRELERVAGASWLRGALACFNRVVNEKRQASKPASITPSVVRAMFVALLTIRSPKT